MIKSDRQRLREWLESTPGEFTIKEAAEGTGISVPHLAFLFKNKGLAEAVGQKKVRYSTCRNQYHVKLYRRAQE